MRFGCPSGWWPLSFATQMPQLRVMTDRKFIELQAMALVTHLHVGLSFDISFAGYAYQLYPCIVCVMFFMCLAFWCLLDTSTVKQVCCCVVFVGLHRSRCIMHMNHMKRSWQLEDHSFGEHIICGSSPS